MPYNRASAPLLIAPSSLDGLDPVLLKYKTSWPLAAILTEDTAVGYAAVFSSMLRVKRVAAVLRRLRPPLALRPLSTSSTPVVSPSAAAVKRLQRIRVFALSAAQLVSAIGTFQGLTTRSQRWGELSSGLASFSQSSSSSLKHPSTTISSSQDHPTTCTTPSTTIPYSSKSIPLSRHQPRKINDLQELLHLHRAYVSSAAADCLTYCGKEEVQRAAETALTSVLAAVLKVEGAIDSGRSTSRSIHSTSEWGWVRALDKEAVWKPVVDGIESFEAAVEELKLAVGGVGRAGPLGTLAGLLQPMR